jgi:hypothetical protein
MPVDPMTANLYLLFVYCGELGLLSNLVGGSKFAVASIFRIRILSRMITLSWATLFAIFWRML